MNDGSEAKASLIARGRKLDIGSAIAARSVILASGIVTGVLTARFFGAQGRGEIALVTAVYANIGAIATLGIDVAVVHFIGSKKFSVDDVSRSAKSLAARCAIGATIAGLILAVALTSNFPDPSRARALIAATVAGPITYALIMQGLLVAVGRLVEVAVLSIFRAFLSLIWIGSCAILAYSPSTALLGLAGVEFVVFIGTLALSRIGGRIDARRPRAPLVRYGLSGHLGSVLQTLNFRLDVFLLAALANLEAVGLYTVAATLAELLWTLPLILQNYLRQRIAKSSLEHRRVLVATAMKVTLTWCVLTGLALAVAAPSAIPWIYGPGFQGATQLLLYLLPGTCAMALYMNMINDLSTRGHPFVKSLTAAIGCIVTLALNLALIPRYGAIGAAIASSAAYTVTLLVTLPTYLQITQMTPRCWIPQRTDVVDVAKQIRRLLTK